MKSPVHKSCDVYLGRLSEPRDNSLRFVSEEAVLNQSGFASPALPELANIIKDLSPSESIEGCRMFELYWKHYAAYLLSDGKAIGLIDFALSSRALLDIRRFAVRESDARRMSIVGEIDDPRIP